MSIIRPASLVFLCSLVSAFAVPPSPLPAHPVNLSTRLLVQTGDKIGIGGFIITGAQPKHVAIRALGPSLQAAGIGNTLADPVLELRGAGSFQTIINNDWKDSQKAKIEADGIAPKEPRESTIDTTLPPGAYTALVTGAGNTSGIALIEVYDLGPAADSKLANLSTRGFVGTGENVVIAGFILAGGSGDDRIVVRGLGPSLSEAGVSDVLANPMLELRDGNGTVVRADDDWQDNAAQAAELSAAGFAPKNSKEAALAVKLPPGLYSAILAGANNTSGSGLIEVFHRGASQHLFVGDDNTPGGIVRFTVPVTNDSPANFKIAMRQVVAIGVDANGNLLAGDVDGALKFFKAPLSNASKPAAVFQNGNAGHIASIAFSKAGDLFTVADAVANRFKPPFTNSTKPSSTLSSPDFISLSGITFDRADNLYLSNDDFVAKKGNLIVYAPPYTGQPIVTPKLSGRAYRAIAVSKTQLFVSSVNGDFGSVDVYKLPITSSSKPTFTITAGMETPEGLAVDAEGNLYVGNLNNATVKVYSPPFSAESAPATVLQAGPATGFGIFGIAIGK